ncbi:MAG: LURP-one-related/scramblase family protein [Faecousia sp.]
MNLYIQQRVFSWTDTYDVYDESGNPKYFVRAELLTIGHQIHVYEKATGREVGSVHQQILTFLPKFEIVIGGQTLGMVRKQFSFLVPRYQVDYRGWDVEGDFLGWDYRVTDGNRTVMRIEKQWLSWGDTYTLSFANPADEIPGLLLVIAIDAANCND